MPVTPPRGVATSRMKAALDLLRPRNVFRALARVEHVADETRMLRSHVKRLEILVEQLTEIARSNAGEPKIDVDRVLDLARIGRHVVAAVNDATLDLEPFPHLVVNDWLPEGVYRAVIHAVPPPIFFADREERRQRLTVPFDLAPAVSHRVWRFLADNVVGDHLARALNARFERIIRAHVSTFCPELPADVDLTLRASDGRIMLRRPGYVIEPHRDPKWGFLTGLVYLARKGDNETYGTQLYRVQDDADAPTARPHYIDPTRCELVRSVPFKANSLLVFLNSRGAHGASIPADATPADLTRLVYQFRLGPSTSTMQTLLGCMPPDYRASWIDAKQVHLPPGGDEHGS